MALDHQTREVFFEKANDIINGVNENGKIEKTYSIEVIQQFITMTRRVIAVYFRKVNELDDNAGGRHSLYNTSNASNQFVLGNEPLDDHNRKKSKLKLIQPRTENNDEFLQYMGMVTTMERAALQCSRRIESADELIKKLELLRGYFAEIIDPSLKDEKAISEFMRPDYSGGKPLNELYEEEPLAA